MKEAKSLGTRIQVLRQKAGLTQQQLCEKAHLSYSTLTKIERGAIRSPSIFTISTISEALGTPLESILKSVTPETPKRLYEASDDVRKVKFVYFDIHGVLVHFYERGFMTLAEEVGANLELVENTFWHYNDAACRGDMSLREFNQLLAKKFGVAKVEWLKHYLGAVEANGPMHDLARDIAKHYKIGLLSNIFPSLLDALLKHKLVPALKYDAVVDSSVVHAIKPERAIFEIAETKANVLPKEILLIDDSRSFVMAAEHLEWHVLWCDDYRPAESARRIRRALGLINERTI